MLAKTLDLLKRADHGKYAVPAFNINNLEILQGALDGAEKMKSPVIVQTSQGACAYAGMENLACLVHQEASRRRIPVAFHFDHGKDVQLVRKAILSRYYSSVMYDGSSLPYAQNVAMTKKIVSLAHRLGITVEAELGAIPGQEDAISVSSREAHFTDPTQTADFVRKTGCDSLAVSIGTAHGAYKFSGQAKLDLRRLEAIQKLVKIPLVLHGASEVPKWLLRQYQKYSKIFHDQDRLKGAHGVPDREVRHAVKMGIDKVNIDTDLRIAFLVALREKLVTDHNTYDPREILSPARVLISKVAAEKTRLLGSVEKWE